MQNRQTVEKTHRFARYAALDRAIGALERPQARARSPQRQYGFNPLKGQSGDIHRSFRAQSPQRAQRGQRYDKTNYNLTAPFV
jgi:hypothetical protein